nr:ABC transporter permease [uncultured Duganella sp.]
MFRNYLLTAWKVFQHRKLFTAINLLCIVLTLVVLMVVTALLQTAFYPTGVEGRGERFVQMLLMRSGHSDRPGWRNATFGYKIIDRYLKPMPGVEAVSASSVPQSVAVYQDGRVSEVMLRRTDAEYWRILDFRILSGRVLNADDLEQGRFVAVINQSTARKLFPGQPWLNRKFLVGGQTFTVVGVVEDALQVNAYADVWAPISTLPSTDYKNQQFDMFTVMIMARSAAELPAVKRELLRIAKTVKYDDPNMFNTTEFWGDSKLELFSRILTSNTDEDAGVPKLMGGIVALMLLFMALPALNLINLNVGRIMERSSEIGVRKAFGATSAQLVAQLVLENVLLCLIGGVIGLTAATGVLWWLEGSGLIPYLKVELNLAVFGYGLLLTLVFGVLSGVIPAWKMSRLDPVRALKGNA